jgi:hypothetical protein
VKDGHLANIEQKTGDDDTDHSPEGKVRIREKGFKLGSYMRGIAECFEWKTQAKNLKMAMVVIIAFLPLGKGARNSVGPTRNGLISLWIHV